MVSVQSIILQTNSWFSLRLSEPKTTFSFCQIRRNAEVETEIGPPLTDRALFSDKAHYLNQPERALYRDFIIKTFLNHSNRIRKQRLHFGLLT